MRRQKSIIILGLVLVVALISSIGLIVLGIQIPSEHKTDADIEIIQYPEKMAWHKSYDVTFKIYNKDYPDRTVPVTLYLQLSERDIKLGSLDVTQRSDWTTHTITIDDCPIFLGSYKLKLVTTTGYKFALFLPQLMLDTVNTTLYVSLPDEEPPEEEPELIVETLDAMNVGGETATIRGHIVSMGSSGSSYYFKWGKDTLTNKTPTIFTDEAGIKVYSLTGLDSNTTYYYKFYANGLSGDTKKFTTLADEENDIVGSGIETIEVTHAESDSLITFNIHITGSFKGTLSGKVMLKDSEGSWLMDNLSVQTINVPSQKDYKWYYVLPLEPLSGVYILQYRIYNATYDSGVREYPFESVEAKTWFEQIWESYGILIMIIVIVFVIIIIVIGALVFSFMRRFR